MWVCVQGRCSVSEKVSVECGSVTLRFVVVVVEAKRDREPHRPTSGDNNKEW